MGNTQKQIDRLAFSPDGRLLACGGKDAFITLWDVQSGKEVRQMKGLPTSVRSLCFSPDGMTLAVGLSSDIRALKLENCDSLTLPPVGRKRPSMSMTPSPALLFPRTAKCWPPATADQREDVRAA